MSPRRLVMFFFFTNKWTVWKSPSIFIHLHLRFTHCSLSQVAYFSLIYFVSSPRITFYIPLFLSVITSFSVFHQFYCPGYSLISSSSSASSITSSSVSSIVFTIIDLWYYWSLILLILLTIDLFSLPALLPNATCTYTFRDFLTHFIHYFCCSVPRIVNLKLVVGLNNCCVVFLIFEYWVICVYWKWWHYVLSVYKYMLPLLDLPSSFT